MLRGRVGARHVTEASPTTLALIAGGKARRLGGVAKGLLELEGRPIARRLVELAPSRFADTLLVSDDAAPYAFLGVRTVGAVVADKGAPGGVHAALTAATTPWVFVVAADMPFVAPAAIDVLLAARREGVDGVLFEVQGRPEPLLAVYRASLAPRWGQALSGNPSFERLFASFSICALPEAALRAVDPAARSVVSVNTFEDARRWGLKLPPNSR